MKIAIWGAGNMGREIAQVFAKSGHTVLLFSSSIASAQKYRCILLQSLQRRIQTGKLTKDTAKLIASRITVPPKKSDTADADLVLECIKEDMAEKKLLLKQLDGLCSPNTVFASNTSSLSITEMGEGLKHSLIGMHFFNPATTMKLVEIVKGRHTTQDVFKFIYDLSVEIGKEPIEVIEAPGFVVNKILIPMLNEAIHLVEMGVASPTDVDKAMQLGGNHPMGPLTLGDFIGWDICLAVMNTLFVETGDPKYCPSPLLKKMVRAGKLGRKSGIGFYNYREELK